MDVQGEMKNAEKERKKSLKVKGSMMNGMTDPGINTKRARNKKKMIKDRGRTE